LKVSIEVEGFTKIPTRICDKILAQKVESLKKIEMIFVKRRMFVFVKL
jgi:hypothetical protein